MKAPYCFVVFVVCFFGSFAKASVFVTPEAAMMQQIVQALEMYQMSNGGQLPANWSEFGKSYDIDALNRQMARRFLSGYPLQDHYEFISKSISLGGLRDYHPNDDDGSLVLLVRTVPLNRVVEAYQSKEPIIRYVVYRNKNGKIAVRGVSEQDIQVLLKNAGLTLMPNPRLPKVELDAPMPEREFFKLHPESDPSRNVSSPSHEGPLAEPASVIPKELQPSSNADPQSTVAVTAQEKGISWLTIGGGFALIMAAAAWLVRRSKNARK